MYIIILKFDFGIGNFQKEAPAQQNLLRSAMGKKIQQVIFSLHPVPENCPTSPTLSPYWSVA